MNNKMVYNVEELCEMLDTNRQCIYMLIETGVLLAFRLGRKYLITAANLNLFLNQYGNLDMSNSEKCIESKVHVQEKYGSAIC